MSSAAEWQILDKITVTNAILLRIERLLVDIRDKKDAA